MMIPGHVGMQHGNTPMVDGMADYMYEPMLALQSCSVFDMVPLSVV